MPAEIFVVAEKKPVSLFFRLALLAISAPFLVGHRATFDERENIAKKGVARRSPARGERWRASAGSSRGFCSATLSAGGCSRE
jgi:hypothetical protein